MAKNEIRIPRNEHVDIVVRRLTLKDATDVTSEHIEIREFIKNGEVWGHGVVFPIDRYAFVLDAIRLIGDAYYVEAAE